MNAQGVQISLGLLDGCVIHLRDDLLDLSLSQIGRTQISPQEIIDPDLHRIDSRNHRLDGRLCGSLCGFFCGIRGQIFHRTVPLALIGLGCFHFRMVVFMIMIVRLFGIGRGRYQRDHHEHCQQQREEPLCIGCIHGFSSLRFLRYILFSDI